MTSSLQRTPAWTFEQLCGRSIEISGASASSALSMVAHWLLEVQAQGEFVAWVGPREHVFFPPDFEQLGIDLEALPVVHTNGVIESARVADLLLRSDGFSLVVCDLGERGSLSLSLLARLTGLAKKHRAVLILLTRKSAREASLGSLISLRADATRERIGFDQFTCRLEVLKDKRRGPGWHHQEAFRGPDGLC